MSEFCACKSCLDTGVSLFQWYIQSHKLFVLSINNLTRRKGPIIYIQTNMRCVLFIRLWPPASRLTLCLAAHSLPISLTHFLLVSSWPTTCMKLPFFCWRQTPVSRLVTWAVVTVSSNKCWGQIYFVVTSSVPWQRVDTELLNLISFRVIRFCREKIKGVNCNRVF